MIKWHFGGVRDFYETAQLTAMRAQNGPPFIIITWHLAARLESKRYSLQS